MSAFYVIFLMVWVSCSVCFSLRRCVPAYSETTFLFYTIQKRGNQRELSLCRCILPTWKPLIRFTCEYLSMAQTERVLSTYRRLTLPGIERVLSTYSRMTLPGIERVLSTYSRPTLTGIRGVLSEKRSSEGSK